MYRCEAATAAGFVQQLACSYLRNGYHHYVLGDLPEGKDCAAIDAKMVERFAVDVSKWVRARRKRAGHGNAHYIRFRRFFVLLATDGDHEFFRAHSPTQVRNIKDKPIAFGGYSIGYHRGVDRKWHVSVRIHPERYRNLKSYFLEIALRRSEGELAAELDKLPFERYAPVRRQLLSLLRAVNRLRTTAGLSQVPVSALRLRRRVVRPFGDYEGLREAA